MNEEEKYLFDINGYIVVRDVLTADEIAAANAAIDHHAHHIQERVGDLSLSGDSPALRGETGRGYLGGALSWEKPHCDPFRAMLAHARLTPYMHEILGPGFRLDHNLGIITMRKGAEGHVLHGSSGPSFDPHQYYFPKWSHAQRTDRRRLAAGRYPSWRWGTLRDSGQPQGQLPLPPGTPPRRDAQRLHKANHL